MPLRGSCHCGKVAFTLDEEAPAQALSCNSRRKGGLLHTSAPDRLTLQGSREDIQRERRMLTIILFIVSLGFVSLPLNAATVPFSVVVDKYHEGQNGQLIDGYKRYKTISAALESAPTNGTERFVIYIKPGRYMEQVRVNKPRISLIGAGRERTILMFAAAVGSRDHTGKLYGRASATLSILASDFDLQAMTVENSFRLQGKSEKRCHRSIQDLPLAGTSNIDQIQY